HLRAVIRLHPGGVGSALERIAGLLGRETGVSRELALAVMQQLVAAHDREPQAQQALAQLALQLDQPALALAAAERAKALSPNWAAPDLLRVQALLKSGEGDEAVGLLGALLKRRPNDHDLRLQYARTLLSLEQTEGALKQFELLLKARPQAAQCRYVAALLALELGEHDKARRYLLQLVNTGQYADDAYFYLGRLAQAEAMPRAPCAGTGRCRARSGRMPSCGWPPCSPSRVSRTPPASNCRICGCSIRNRRRRVTWRKPGCCAGWGGRRRPWRCTSRPWHSFRTMPSCAMRG